MSATRAAPPRHRTLFNRWLIVHWRLDHHGVGAMYTALLSVVYGIKLRPKRHLTVQYTPNYAQKDTSWFNKLLILLNSGRRPPLCLQTVFVREEQCLIISHPHSTSQARSNRGAPFSSPLGTGDAYCVDCPLRAVRSRPHPAPVSSTGQALRATLHRLTRDEHLCVVARTS